MPLPLGAWWWCLLFVLIRQGLTLFTFAPLTLVLANAAAVYTVYICSSHAGARKCYPPYNLYICSSHAVARKCYPPYNLYAVIHQGEISCHVSFPLGFDVGAQEKGRERKEEAESSGREGAGISGTDREGFQESWSERLTRQLRDGQTFKGRFVCTVRSSKWTKKFCFRAARRQQYADLLCSTICGTIGLPCWWHCMH